MNSTHPLLSQLSSPHYLVVENLRGLSSERPLVWDDHATGSIVGMSRFYPAARKMIPTPSWPADAEARAALETHFPTRAVQLSCGGVVDQRQPLSFDDHPESIVGTNDREPRDRILFGRTFTIVWMAAGDEDQIKRAMMGDRKMLVQHFEAERERLQPQPWLSWHGADSFVRRWFDRWYLSRLCRLPEQTAIDFNRIRQILDAMP